MPARKATKPISFKLELRELEDAPTLLTPEDVAQDLQQWKVTYTVDGKVRSRDVVSQTAQQAVDQVLEDPVFEGHILTDMRVARYGSNKSRGK